MAEVTEASQTNEILVVVSAEAMLGIARERLKAALQLLGAGGESTVADDVAVGAGVLSREAGDALDALLQYRFAVSVAKEGKNGEA